MVAPANFTKFTNIAFVMGEVMSQLGLAVPTMFVGSQDQNVTQLLSLLTSAGQDLCTMEDWQFLHKTFTLNLVPGQTYYSLPDDWNGFVSSTMWNNTQRLPVIGPLTPQVWRMLKARLISGTTISLEYRIVGNRIELYRPSNTADVIQADYYSRGWLQDAPRRRSGTTFRTTRTLLCWTAVFSSCF